MRCKVILFFLFSLSQVCQAEPHCPGYSSNQPIWEAASNCFISPQALVLALRDIDYVLIGEQHHQAKQLNSSQDLLDALLKHHTQAVLFEMLGQHQLPWLEQLNKQGKLPLKAPAIWQDSGWSWQAYAPLLATVLAHDRQLAAASFSPQQIQALYQGKATQPWPFDLDASMKSIQGENRRDIIEQVNKQHGGKLNSAHLNSMTNIQIARDANMAYALRQHPRAILIAGNFHVRKDYGAAQHLRFQLKKQQTKQAPRSIRSLIQLNISSAAHAPAALEVGGADFIWLH